MGTAPVQTSKKGLNTLWWVLGIVVAAVVLFGVGGLLALQFIARNVTVQEQPGSVEISTPMGSIKASKDAPVDPGLPLYEGAVPSEAPASVELSSPDGQQLSILKMQYRTKDPLVKVDEWYTEKLGREFRREGSGVSTKKKEIFGAEIRSEDVAFISEKDKTMQVVALKKTLSGTEIVLLRISEAEPQ